MTGSFASFCQTGVYGGQKGVVALINNDIGTLRFDSLMAFKHLCNSAT